MRVTFISPPPDLSGGQRVIATHADLLAKRGHHVTIFATERKKPSRIDRLRALARGRRLPKPSSDSHYKNSWSRLFVHPHHGPLTATDVDDADVVIATWWETAFMVARFPESKGRKFYLVQHHEVHSHLPSHISAGSYYLPLKKIAVSSWLVDAMRDLYGDDDVALVPNSVDQKLFHAPERGRQSVPTVGLMYSQTHFKGVDVALQAIEIAKRKHPNLRLIAFGSQAPVKALPLPEWADFHLRPPQDKLRELYASCDVFIAASRSEGFGLPILEAMACRTPVVATRTGCVPDVIRHGVNGMVTEIDDAEALGAGLSEILASDDARWRAMSDAALQTTRAHTWDDASAQFERALFDQVPRDVA